MAIRPAINMREQRQKEGRLGALGQGREDGRLRKMDSPRSPCSNWPKKMHVLHDERLIEAEARAQCGDVLRRGVGPEHHGRRIARRDAHDDEDDRDHDEHHGEHAEKALKDVTAHAVHMQKRRGGEHACRALPAIACAYFLTDTFQK